MSLRSSTRLVFFLLIAALILASPAASADVLAGWADPAAPEPGLLARAWQWLTGAAQALARPFLPADGAAIGGGG